VIDFLACGLAGWLAGAAENWAADRLPEVGSSTATDRAPRAEPVGGVRGLAHDFTLPWYAARGGICPHCGEKRPLRAPLLEAATIGAFLITWWRFRGDPLHTAVVCLYAAFLLTVLVIDFEQRLVLNIMLAPAAVIALLVSVLPGDPTPLSALLGGAAGLGLFLLIALFGRLIGRGAMGAGDIKLAGVIGLMTGFPDVLRALVLGILLGGVAALVLLIARRAGRRGYMAYAPYLALGALVVLWAGV
jgi:leader peptidase (prepilin peptidase)/N-methyltransferase